MKRNLPEMMYQTKYNLNWRQLLKLELKSLMARKIHYRFRPFTQRKKILNVGCGDKIFSIADNIDFPIFKWWKKNYYGIDLRYYLPIKEETYSGIFCEHTLEHLSPDEVESILYELFRILEKNGVIRVVVPTLDKYQNWIESEELLAKFSFQDEAHAIWHLTQHYGHKSTWNFKSLKRLLTNIGFQDVKLLEKGVGETNLILLENTEREWESVYIEARKI